MRYQTFLGDYEEGTEEINGAPPQTDNKPDQLPRNDSAHVITVFEPKPPVAAAQKSEAPKKLSVGGALSAIAFLAFFVASLVGMAVFSQTNMTLCLTIFGVYFIVFGSIAVKKTLSVRNIYPLLMPLFGVVITGMSLTYAFGSTHTKGTVLALMPYCGLGVFLIAGIFFILSALLYRQQKSHACTATVTAQCVRHKCHLETDSQGRSCVVVCPVYRYRFDGQEFVAQEDLYTNVGVPQIGEEISLFVNPDDPYDIYRPSFAGNAIPLTIGICFVAVSVLGGWLYTFS